jgi:hypothetical protein
MTAEQALQEVIITLQKQCLSPETRKLVEEAAQLLADGRDIEARALLEKAQAITSAATVAKTNGAAKVNGPGASEPVDPTIASRISARLAQGITDAVTAAIEDLHHEFSGQIKAIVSSLEGRINEMAAQLRGVADIEQRVARIEQEEPIRATVAQERWDQMAASITLLEENDRSRRVEVEEFNRNVLHELQSISSRVTAQGERFVAFNRLAEDLSSKVSSAIGQIDRHTDWIRSMQERQVHRAAALNEALEAIAKLREPNPLAGEMVDG